MKKASSQPKAISKGKSTSSIYPYHQSRVTNRSNDTNKIDSKVSKVSKTNSVVRLHQPLTIQNRTINKQSTRKSSSRIIPATQLPQSRKKIQSHLENKNSYHVENPVSFRQTEGKGSSVRTRETRTQEGRVENVSAAMERENKELKERLVRLQESSIQDKEKIRVLISRISQMKRDSKLVEQSSIGLMSKSKTTSSYAHILRTRAPTDRQNPHQNQQTLPHQKPLHQTPFRILQPTPSQYSKNKQICGNVACEERRKHLEGELYKERIKRDQLEEEKREWERSRDVLKRQYQEMLGEIQELRSQVGGEVGEE